MIRLPLYFLICTVVFFLFTGCKNDTEPLYSSLDTAWVNKVYEQEGMIFAATEKGIWKKHSADANLWWEGMGLHKEYVRDFIIFDSETLLAGINIDYTGEGTVSLFRTTSGGSSWHPYLNNYGGKGGWTWIRTLTKHPFHSDTLFSTGSVNVARSTDRGKHWESVYAEWEFGGMGNYFVKIDEQFPENVWSGGQSTIFTPYLLRSQDVGETWERIQVFEGGDNVCFDVSIHPTNPDRVLVGMGGGIADIDAAQETFTPVFAAPAYFRSLKASPSDPQTVYAGPQDGGTLKFYKTTDWGQNWETIEHPGGFMADVIDVLVTDHTGEDVIYLATTKGVFSYSNGTFNRF